MLNHMQRLIHGIRGPRPRVVAYNCGDNTPLTTPITFLELYMNADGILSHTRIPSRKQAI